MRRLLLAAALSLCVPAVALAEDAVDPPDPDVEGAKLVLKQYLDALVKGGQGAKPKAAEVAKKLQAAKKLIHPKTLELIADQEKKNLAANAMNGLAAWNHAKEDYWLKEFELGDARKSELGTVVIETHEKNWRVSEGGEDGEFEIDSYLVGKSSGKWLVIDKRRNEAFTDKAIKVGYKDYLDGAKPVEKKEPPAPKKEE